MKDTIIAIAVVALMIFGFWWSRGAGGIPGGTDDPAREEFNERFTRTGGPMPQPGEDIDIDREHEVE